MATQFNFFPLSTPKTRRISKTPRTLRRTIEYAKKISRNRKETDAQDNPLYTVKSPLKSPSLPDNNPPTCIADCLEQQHINPQIAAIPSLIKDTDQPVSYRELTFILAALAAITLNVRV